MSFNQHGTRVIQKIFERIINNPSLLRFYTVLMTPNIFDFMIDPNSNHIIIKYLSLITSPTNDFLIEFLAKKLVELANKQHSCCALQKCIELANPQQKHY